MSDEKRVSSLEKKKKGARSQEPK